ncbi:DUF2730 family protein [Telmatospirillum sp. J64-1]|uniref:DUF2730 family protein n=1 Tax=Telmatospirillum sp. J64-1 TaxID=2502183 RepID=UPI00115DE1D4|nr:DUF2730 family protein [Telmatospirillum sp. J64-1]
MAEWSEWLKMALMIGGTAGGAISTICAWIIWAMRREWVTKAELSVFQTRHAEQHAELDRRLQVAEVRFERLETSLRHMPTKEDLAQISEAVANVAAAISGIEATVRGMSQSVAGLQDTVTMLVRHELSERRTS